MTSQPNIFSIPFGAPFLATLVEAVFDGALVSGTAVPADPLALADTTIFVPTRRSARELRAIFVEQLNGKAAILPNIRPLGEFEEDIGAFEPGGAEVLNLAPPIGALDRILVLAPLVRAWKSRLPAHISARFDENVVVPASTSDAIWLARDLANLMDEVEIEGASWSRLADLVPADLAGWWQVSLDFLAIVTEHFPAALNTRAQSSPGAHLTAMIDAETARLKRNPPKGPVIAAGSTGSIPATARLLGAISQLPSGALVLPGLDQLMDVRSWDALGLQPAPPSVFGHPQYGLQKLLAQLGVDRSEVVEIGVPVAELAERSRLFSEALRPAETTDGWAESHPLVAQSLSSGALDRITVIQAANEQEEAQTIAVALRAAIANEGHRAALVTPDRTLARRVSVELARFGILADDSGGRPLDRFAATSLLLELVEVVFSPGDPVRLLSLLKNPLLCCGLPRSAARKAAETIELVALRGGTGRPDISQLGELFSRRLEALKAEDKHRPFWFVRLSDSDTDNAKRLLSAMAGAIEPLAILRSVPETDLATITTATITALENLGRAEDGALAGLYAKESGESLIAFLRELLESTAPLRFAPSEWPAMLTALLANQTVKPAAGSDNRVAIWGVLEARLQTVDTLVLGGLNEGSWPRRAEADRFMSRMMKSSLELEPPERRIGQSAHDFWMAAGTTEIILSHSLRSQGAPAVASRWLQRLLAYVGEATAKTLIHKGNQRIHWARQLDHTAETPEPFKRPRPTPPIEARPDHFSITEIETLRRDPYAVYARRILRLRPLEPLIRDPGAVDRGSLFHDILHEFIRSGADPRAADAEARLLEAGRTQFDIVDLPPDVEAVWWPRFAVLAEGIIRWERDGRPTSISARLTEVDAAKTEIGATGATLSGRADRIDLVAGGLADILDYKTGSYPSKGQAHTLLSPQLALEGALLSRGAFAAASGRKPSALAYVRLKPNGDVLEESVLTHNKKTIPAEMLAEDAWQRLGKLVNFYADPQNGYISRALPFREGDTDGDYDHLARVLEWSASGGDGEAGE